MLRISTLHFVRKLVRFKVPLLTVLLIFLTLRFIIPKNNYLSSFDKDIIQKDETLDFFLEKKKNKWINDVTKDYESYINRTAQLRSTLNSLHSIEKISEPNKRPVSSINKKTYLIVEYTKVFYATKFCHLKDSDYIYPDGCLYKNCRFTCDKSTIYTADALLFHDFDLNQVSIEERIFLKYTLSKGKSRQNQVWILWNDEPDLITTANQIDYYKFNWTMSYRIDSEVSDCAYGCYSQRFNFEKQQKAIHETKLLSQFQKEFDSRENSALWFVSNCKAKYRLKFASQLQDRFNIKVYGKCKNKLKKIDGHFSYITEFFQELKQILKSTFMNILPLKKINMELCDRDSNCEEQQLKRNKFYLSFESQNCTNYITEKFWRILNANAIPIVLQPSKDFYDLIAPPNSYIHAQDFDYDASKLANYLNWVSNTFEAYFNYQKWRSDYDISFANKQTEARRMCELCTKLNTESSRIYYRKVSQWFNSGCIRN